jgi:glutamate-1-semialdehyde 2,1-aminomutase
MPDMAVFGKGLANGMPISVYAGKKELLDSAPAIAISSTFGGETLSLAAAKAAISIYRKKNVIGHLWKTGKKMWNGVRQLFKKYSVNAGLKGFDVCPSFWFSSPEEQELFNKLCYRNGVSLYNVSYVNYSHKDKDIAEALRRIEKAIKEMKKQ